MSASEPGAALGRPFTVRRKVLKGGLAAGVVLGIVGFVGGVILALAVEDARLVFVLIAGAGAAAGIISGALVAAKRESWDVTLCEDGIRVHYKGGEIPVAFGELAAVGHVAKEQFSNGRYAGINRRLRFWRKGDPPNAPFLDIDAYCSEKKQSEEARLLGEVFSRACASVADRLAAVIAEGGTAKAPGMQLTSAALTAAGVTVPLADIAATGYYAERLCVWRRGEDVPFLRLDPTVPNVVPFIDIIDRVLEANEPEADDTEGMGRVLFEKRASKASVRSCFVLGVLTFWLFGLGLLLIFISYYLKRKFFRCHQRGVVQGGLGGSKQMRYEDIGRFTYSATRQYYNGAYIGTSLGMVFVPQSGNAKETIRFSTTVKNIDRDLDNLRDHIASVVARKMVDTLDETGSVSWTPTATLTREGVRYRKGKLLGKGEWLDLPFPELAGFNLHEGYFHLFRKGTEKSIFNMPCNGENFYPGFAAFQAVWARESGESGGA